MGAPKGHPRYGGRTKGTRNKRTQALQAHADKTGRDPVGFMLAAMANEKLDFPVRLDAAKSVAPYLAPRLSSVDGTIRAAVVDVTALTAEQRQQRARALIREAFRERTPLTVEGDRVVAGKDNRDAVTVGGEQASGEPSEEREG